MSFLRKFYVDDGLNIHKKSHAANVEAHVYTIKLLKKLGLVVNDDKIVGPKTNQFLLGFQVDTKTMTVKINAAKDHELLYLFSIYQGEITARFMATVLGKAISLIPALLFNPVLFFPNTVKLIHSLVDIEDKASWDRTAMVTQTLKLEFFEFLQFYPHMSGKSLHPPVDGRFVSMDDIKMIPDVSLYVGDSGQDNTVVAGLTKRDKYRLYTFTPFEKVQSSSYRELLALQTLVDSDMLTDNEPAFYITDSQVLQTWYYHGTSKDRVAAILKHVHLTLMTKHIVLQVVWQNRWTPEIMECDTSQHYGPDDFSLRDREWSMIKKEIKAEFVLDVYAHTALHQAPRFFTASPMVASAGSPGQHQDWDDQDGWVLLFPPKALIHLTVRKLLATPHIKAVLVVVDTRQDAAHRLLLQSDGHFPITVTNVWKLSTGIHVPAEMEYKSYFAGGWHSVWVIFFNSTAKNTNLSTRCPRPPGDCQEPCLGNPRIQDWKKHQYPSKKKLRVACD